MNLVDANILIYAYDDTSPLHDKARTYWSDQLSGVEQVRLGWLTIVAFLRLATNWRIFERPLSVEEATRAVSEWLSRPQVGVLHPTERHWPILEKLMREAQASANLVNDAHLAALAIEHGATLCSTDRDFSRFEGLKWEDPLAGGG